MSRIPLRPLATILLVAGALVAGAPALAADNTWSPAALPGISGGPVVALAVNPANGNQLLVGDDAGVIYLSDDAGSSWRVVKRGLGRGVTTLAYDPQRPRTILAGTRGAGVWRSTDSGATWAADAGTERRTIRAFAFARGVELAGGAGGALVSRDGGSWSAVGLANVSVSTLAATPDGSLLIAGGDASQGGERLPLYTSVDSGQTWAMSPAAEAGAFGASSIVAALAGDAQRLLVGTNGGLFQSLDQGATWQQVTAGGTLPATDVTALAFAPRHAERLYLASDGGGAMPAGLWTTADGGTSVTALVPSGMAVTGLAVSADDTPTLLIATLRPRDGAVTVWTYRDAGGPPQVAAISAPTPASGGQARAVPVTHRWAAPFPELPYAIGGALAVVIVLVALGLNARRRRLP